MGVGRERAREHDDQLRWLDEETFLAMIAPSDPSEAEPTWFSDGWYDWCWQDDDWYAYVDGAYFTWSEMKPWMDADEIAAVDSEAGKEVKDLYAAFEQKIRTFKEARDHVRQKGKNRGFFPYVSKGSSKGKGKSKKGNKGASFVVGTPNQKGKGTSNAIAKKPGYTGCFICADPNHDFRNCPQRGRTSASSSFGGKSRPICMVQSVECSDDGLDDGAKAAVR